MTLTLTFVAEGHRKILSFRASQRTRAGFRKYFKGLSTVACLIGDSHRPLQLLVYFIDSTVPVPVNLVARTIGSTGQSACDPGKYQEAI